MTKKNTAEKIDIENEEAPLEAYPPQAVILQDEDFLIRGCDGDHEYVWIAHKLRKTYRVTEVYPGLAEPETALREADDLDDLILTGRYTSLSEVLETIAEALFDGFETPTQKNVKQLPS
jgi:hypothetical protein